jgi:hypothetical protein
VDAGRHGGVGPLVRVRDRGPGDVLGSGGPGPTPF